MACLQSGEGLFVHQIASQTKVIRSTIDLALKRLVSNGFLSKSKIGKRWIYKATPPEAILFQQKSALEDFEEVLPVLAKLRPAGHEMDVQFFEGKEGLIKAHRDVLIQTKLTAVGKKDILSFTSAHDTYKIFPDINRAFINKRIKNGSWYKAIATSDSKSLKEWSTDEKFLRTIKYLPSSTKFGVEIQIYADSLMIFSTKPPFGGVIIKNPNVAESMRNLFNFVWAITK